MKKSLSASLVILVAALTLALTQATLPAQSFTTYKAQFAGSKVTIDGTSTLHDWTVEGQIIGGQLDLDSSFSTDPAKNTSKPGPVKAKVTVSVPVSSLKSGKALMDTVMQDTMHMDQHPKIEFALTDLELRDPPKAGEPLRFNCKGDLTVSGVKKAIAMPVAIEQVAEGKLKIVGSVPLKMTDFGMKTPAPKIAMGMIKTGDDVKIGFTWVVATPKK